MNADSPAQDEVGADAQDQKEDAQHPEGAEKLCLVDVELLEYPIGVRHAALHRVRLAAVQVLAVVAIDALQDAFEREPDIREIREPPQVDGNSVERDEEAAEQQNWYRCHGTQENCGLQGAGSSNEEAE